MAILRSLDGRFFEIPDDQLNQFLIPAEQVKDKLDAAGAPQVPPGPQGGGPGPGPESSGAPTILVQIIAAPPHGSSAPPPTSAPTGEAAPTSEVQPYGWWNNWWHNARPGWNNWWHNMHR